MKMFKTKECAICPSCNQDLPERPEGFTKTDWFKDNEIIGDKWSSASLMIAYTQLGKYVYQVGVGYHWLLKFECLIDPKGAGLAKSITVLKSSKICHPDGFGWNFHLSKPTPKVGDVFSNYKPHNGVEASEDREIIVFNSLSSLCSGGVKRTEAEWLDMFNKTTSAS